MTTNVNRRRFLVLAALAGTGSLLAACSPATPPAPTAAPTTPPKPAAAATPAPPGPARPEAPAAAVKPTIATAATAPSPARGGILSIGTDRGGDGDVIGTGRHYARSLYNSLVRSDDKGNITTELAESWEIPDPQTYTFKLRQGILFHDGTPFDAAAVKFNFERLADPATKGLFISDFSGMESIDVLDPHTVRVRLKQPDVTLLGRLSGKGSYFASPAAVRQWGADYGLHPVGTGPFQFVSLVPDTSLTLKRWDRYWEKDEQGSAYPYLEGIVFKTLTDATARFNALRGGEIQFMDELLPRDAEVIRTIADLTYVEAPGSSKWLWLNGGKPPFNTKPLRQAVAYAVDRDGIHKGVFNSTGSEGRYMYSPLNWAYDETAPFYRLDPAQVKAKLAEGGQPGGFAFVAHVANTTLDLQLAQAIKGQLATQGIQMNIEVVQTQAIANQRRQTGDFEASLSQFSPYPDPNDTLFPYLRAGLSTNYPRYDNPRVNELLDRAKGELKQDGRKAMYAEIQRLVTDDSPIIFLHHDAKLTGLSRSVQGYRPTVDTYVGFTERLWLRK